MKIPMYLRIALAIELALSGLPCLWPSLNGILPLGGNDMAQLGIVFCVCFVFHEVRDMKADERR
jgi:hypothetical protein